MGQEFVVNADGNLVMRSPQKECVFTVATPDALETRAVGGK